MKKRNEFILFALIQIFLLINLTTANSYLIGSSNLDINSNNIEEENDFNGLIDMSLDFLISFLTIKQIGSVSAVGYDEGNCCISENSDGSGMICQPLEFGSTDLGNGKTCENGVSTSCADTSDCQLGICVENHGEFCSVNSPRSGCNTDDDRIDFYEDSSLDEISDCRLGCCSLGSNVDYLTEAACALDTNFGPEATFNPHMDFGTCVESLSLLDQGACVFENSIFQRTCEFTTKGNCNSMGGEFSKDHLCTNPILETVCKPTTDTICVTDNDLFDSVEKHNVYFVDSCGNPANVYDSRYEIEEEKIEPSFDGTYSVSKEYWMEVRDADCTSDPEDCGICSYDTGASKCLEDLDNEVSMDYFCRDLSCPGAGPNNANMGDGDQWCVYESLIGESRDVVGSEYWMRECFEGEIRIVPEPNNQRRNYICADNREDDPEAGYWDAQYRINLWPLCSGIPIEEEDDDQTQEDLNKEACLEIPDCRVLTIEVDTYFNFDVCVPKYPVGLDISASADDETKDFNEALCGSASLDCTIIRKKEGFGGLFGKGAFKVYDKHNADCRTTKFLEKMNNFCSSLGDCGGNINVEGEGFRGFTITGEGADGIGPYELSDYDSDYWKSELSGNNNPTLTMETPEFFNLADEGTYEDYGGPEDPEANEDTPLRDIGTALIVIAGIIGFIPVVGWGIVGIVAAVGLLLSLIEGEEWPEVISFTCEPWEAPVGSADCSACHDGSLNDLPCTEYKCNSLGTGCLFVDQTNVEDVESLCIPATYDTTPPIINFSEIEDGYLTDPAVPTTANIEITNSEGCFERNTNVNFKIITEGDGDNGYENSVCGYSFETVHRNVIGDDLRESYGSLPGTYKESGFRINHSFSEILSLEHEGIYERVEGDEGTTGMLDMFIRCQNPSGKYNDDEYMVRFPCISSKDLTPPDITGFSPEENSYLSYGETDIPLTISLSEPAECKYDLTEGMSYEAMNFEIFNCNTDFSSPPWSCTKTFTDLFQNGNEETIYIKCNDTSGNMNKDDREYTFRVSESELNIDSVFITYDTLHGTSTLDLGINPENFQQITAGGSGFKFFEADLDVRTSGGAYSGVAECKYDKKSSSTSTMGIIRLLNTDSTEHDQPGIKFLDGESSISLTCNDLSLNGGNEITVHTGIDLDLDGDAPKIVRAFKDGSSLKLISDEQAICYYSNDKIKGCGFNIDDEEGVTPMSGVFNIEHEHTADWDSGKTYYVKCKDLFDNTNSRCAQNGIIYPT